MFVQNVVVAVLGDVVLKKAKAIAVNRPDIHRPEAIEECGAFPLLDALQDPVLQFESGTLREGESDDGVRGDIFIDQRGDTLCDRFGLAGAGTGNDLKVRTAVLYGAELRRRELWTGYAGGINRRRLKCLACAFALPRRFHNDILRASITSPEHCLRQCSPSIRLRHQNGSTRLSAGFPSDHGASYVKSRQSTAGSGTVTAISSFTTSSISGS